jgi:hypothetical protein
LKSYGKIIECPCSLKINKISGWEIEPMVVMFSTLLIKHIKEGQVIGFNE